MSTDLEQLERLGSLREELSREIGKKIVGQKEVIDQLLVVLYGYLTMGMTNRQEDFQVFLKPVLSAMLVDVIQETVHQALPPHAVTQGKLIFRTHKQKLVDQQLRVVGVVRAAQTE